MSILITTYEGTHNHPLPVSATAMASTTSAAACMLMSGSSTSTPQHQQHPMGTTSLSPTTPADLHGLNFTLSDHNSRARPPFYPFPNPSITASPSYPTITLDLTSPPRSAAAPPLAPPHSQFNWFSTNFSSSAARYSPSNFNFSSSSSPSESNTTWANGCLSYGGQPYKPNQVGALNLQGRQPAQEHFYQSYLQKSNSSPPQQSMADTIAAATKVLTSDPSFRSALAAAISSIVGGGGGGAHGSQGGGLESLGQKLKWGEAFQGITPPYAASSNGLNRTASGATPNNAQQQQGSFMFLPPALPFSSTKSTSASPVDNREHIN